jgi:hypothetical protein
MGSFAITKQTKLGLGGNLVGSEFLVLETNENKVL